MSSELLLVSGDSDKRVDVPTDADGIRFRDLLDSMGLLQRVRRPNGHTLDTFTVTPLIYSSPVNLMTSSRKSQEQRDISQTMRLSYVTYGELNLPLQSSTLNFRNSKQLISKNLDLVLPAYSLDAVKLHVDR